MHSVKQASSHQKTPMVHISHQKTHSSYQKTPMVHIGFELFNTKINLKSNEGHD